MRYLKASLILGLLVALAVAALFYTGSFAALDLALANFLRQPPSGPQNPWVQYSLITLFAFGIAWTTIDIPRSSLKAIVASGALLEVIAAVAVLSLHRIFFSPFPSIAAIAGSYLAAFLYSQSEAGSRKKILRQILGDRVSERTFKSLLDSQQPLALDGERREITVIVCEIFNSDALESSLPATDYVALTNAFRRNAADFLVENGGYLDECDGESVRVVFGAPLSDANHAAQACAAALALTERLDEVNRECHAIWKQMFDFRVGINSGEMVVGAYGSRRLGNYSVSGEPVEFTRRLCRANLIYGSRLLIGTSTFGFAEEAIEVRPMEIIQRYDDGQREEIYELLALKDILSFEDLERRDLFWKGVVCYREKLWDDSLGLFYSARSSTGTDGPVEFYIRRIEQLRSGVSALDWKSARL